MFSGSTSIWHWLIVLVVIVLIFGTKKLVDVGGDLGKAVKSFKDGLKGEEEKAAQTPAAAPDKPDSAPPKKEISPH